MKLGLSKSAEISQVKLCGEKAIEIAGQTMRPDQSTAYVEFVLSHAFPVVTVDETALYPQVVANSYRSMKHKVFDLAHLMKAYDPKNNPRDRILGTVIEVELTGVGAGEGNGSYEVRPNKSEAIGIHAVACMHKQAEQVEVILEKYFSGQMQWTVSMEQEYFLDNSGFIATDGGSDLSEWEEGTPESLRDLGWIYIPYTEAPDSMIDCFIEEECKVKRHWKGRRLIFLSGGLDGAVHYKGVGLTPLGKEKEAEVSQMLASEKLVEVGGKLVPPIVSLLAKTASFEL